MNEPACAQNDKSKSGCAKPQPGATQGGCCFDGARNALLPIADAAHIVHGPIGCAGSSWDNRGTRSSGVDTFRIGMTTDLSRHGRHHGPRREAPVPGHPAGGRNVQASGGFRLQHLRAGAPRRRYRSGHKGCCREARPARHSRRLRGLLRQQEPRQSPGGRCHLQARDRHARAAPAARLGGEARHQDPRREPHRRMECRRRVLERRAALRRAWLAHPVHVLGRCPLPRSADHAPRGGQYGGLLQGHAACRAQAQGRLRHAVLRGQLLRHRRHLAGVPRFCRGDRGRRSDCSHRDADRARGGKGRSGGRPIARPSRRQARAGFRGRLQILVARLGHAGPRHGRRRHRHREIDRGRQGAHRRADGAGRPHDLRQRSDRADQKLPRLRGRHPRRRRPLHLSGAEIAHPLPRHRPCAPHRLRGL